MLLTLLELLNGTGVTRPLLHPAKLHHLILHIGNPPLNLLVLMHRIARCRGILTEVGIVVAPVAEGCAIFYLNDPVHLCQHISVVGNDEHRLLCVLEPIDKLLLGDIIHMVGWLIDQRKVGLGVHNLHHFH